MTVKVTINKNWSTDIERGMKVALLEMTTDIHKRSTILAPKDTRALVNSGVIEPVQDGYKVKYGSSRVPYARRRHFENKKNPGSLGYLAKAGDSVARSDKSKYFRGKV
jgi:hypothetical protein